jgi:DNA-binding LacI/PurR family transcriptional regulator
LVTFDGLPWMTTVRSAVSQPVVSLATLAAELLLARLSRTADGPPRTVWLEPTFEHGSTRRLEA